MFDIPKEQLQFLTEKKFTVEEMAQQFGVSKLTLERRLSDFGLSAALFRAKLPLGMLSSFPCLFWWVNMLEAVVVV